MPNRFPGKSCVLCPNPSEGVAEHVVPRWFISDFGGDAPFQSENAGRAYRNRDGDIAVQQSLPGTHVPMCSDCNNRMDAKIEHLAKPVIRKLIPHSADHAWPTLSADEAAAAGRWLLKIGLLWFHPEAVHDQPQVQNDRNLSRFKVADIEPEWLEWMRKGTEPPASFTVFVSRRSLLAAVAPWLGGTRRIELPRFIHVDENRELRFVSRSFGIRGLDVTMVWHPGWPIQHPLVAEHKAAILWPNPVAVNFSALDEVHPDEFLFDTFTLGQETTADNYRKWTAEHPLTEGVPPVLP